MPANVESMFSYRTPAWWDTTGEHVIQEYPGSWAEARELAGLAWDAIEETAYRLTGVDENGREIFEPIEGWKQIVRSDTHATLSINMDSYQIIDHTAMGEIVEAVLAEPNVKWETAGSLQGGRQVWCLAYLDEPIELPGDSSWTLPYLAITNRHDGTASCALRATAVRIVCANTFRAAEMEGEATGATFSFTHRGNWRSRVDEARQAVTGARREFADYRKLSEELLGISITHAQRRLFVAEFLPMPPTGLITDRVARNVEEARQAVYTILDSPTTAGVADTGYGLVQAAGEYLDHVRRSRSWETKLGRTLMKSEPAKAKALALVRQVTSA